MRKIYFFVAAATSFVFLFGVPVIALAAFVVGDPVITIANTNVRSSPEIISTNVVGTVPTGTKGVIKDGPRIGSGRTDWYNVDYTGGMSGWSAAAYFKKDIPSAPGASSPTVPGAEVLHCQLFAPQQVRLGQPFDITWTTSANTRQFTYRGGWGDFVSPIISPEPAPEQVLGDAENGCLNTEGTADAKKCKITASLNTPGTYKGTFWAEGSGVNKPCTVYITTVEEPAATQSSSAFQITGPSQVQVGQPFTISYKKRSDIFYSSLFAWRGWQGAQVIGTAYQQTPASNDYPKAIHFFKGLQLPWLYSNRIGEYPCQSGDCASMNVTVNEPGTSSILFSLYADTGGLIGNYKYTVTATGSATPPPPGPTPPPPPAANTNCVANPATATTGMPVTFTSTAGTPYVWVAAGGDPRSGTDAVFTTRFVQAGNQSVVGYKYDGTAAICNITITGTSTPPPPPGPTPPPPPAPVPPPPPANACTNNWNASTGGYYQKPGTSCPCQYFDGNGGQPIGPAISSSCSPVQQNQTPADTTGLNLSPQRFGSAQPGQIVWVKETTAPGVTDSGYYVYTGTDFPVGSEASWIKSYGGGTLMCQYGSFATKYGTLVTSSGGNANVFKLNGRSEEDGLFVWWRAADGSYDWRRMTIDEYRAENAFYETIGRGNVPYAPNCVLNGTSNIQGIPLPHYFKAGDKIEVDAFKLRGGRDRLNVRTGPSGESLGSEAPLVGQQSAGTQGCVVDGKAVSISNHWYKIDFDSGVDGWVAPFIKKVGTCSGQSPESAATSSGSRVRVVVGAGSNLNVRAAAAGAVVGSQQDGAQGSIVAGPQTANGVNWVQVNFDTGVDGWVAQQFLQY